MNRAKSETRRSHRFTRLGFHFLFVGSFAMLGGALRGFNLLLILAGLLVGALVMQWRWSRRSVEAISARRRIPKEAFASTAFRVRYRLSNDSQFMPVWMIRVEEQIERVDHTEKAIAVCGVGVISAGQTVVPHYDCVIARRGHYRIGPVTLMTTFPFALFSSKQIADAPEELCIFPEILNLRSGWQRSLISHSNGIATNAKRSGQNEGDFFGLREYQSGDNPKWIHWRTSARLDQLAVRQFEQQHRYDLCLLLDAWQEKETRENADVEFAISLVATFLVRLVSSPSNQIVLAVAAEKSDAVMGGGSEIGKRVMLERLADVQPSPQARVGEAAKEALKIVSSTQDLVVVSTRSLEQATRDDPECMKSIQPWIRRSSFRWIDITNDQIGNWVSRDRGATASNGQAGSVTEKSPRVDPNRGDPSKSGDRRIAQTTEAR